MRKVFMIIIFLGIMYPLSSCQSVYSTPPYSEIIEPIVYEEETITMSILAQFVSHNSIEEVASISSHVVRARVLNSRTDYLNRRTSSDRYSVYTISELKILQSFKGDLVYGNTMKLLQEGGQFRNIILDSNGKIPLHEGEDYIFFLNRGTNINSGFTPFFVTAPYYSVYRMVGYSPPYLVRNMPIRFENAHPTSNFFLGFSDLISIAEIYNPREIEPVEFVKVPSYLSRELSEYGIQVTKEFLRDFKSMFTIVGRSSTTWTLDLDENHIPSFSYFDSVSNSWGRTYEPPLLYFSLLKEYQGNSQIEWRDRSFGFYTREGTHIEEAPCLELIFHLHLFHLYTIWKSI